ncbi:MAG TPA: VCBS repeat-containing protein [Kiritimatiellia bacterium]|jgi:hypothetical protein
MLRTGVPCWIALTLVILSCPFDARAGVEDSDFDGDGRTDQAVYHAATGIWYIRQSASTQLRQVHFGWSQSEPVPGDYDGDRRADLCVYSSRSATWYQILSSNGERRTIAPFGSPEMDPVMGDFDGDGRNDLAVYHPPQGKWHVHQSSNGQTVQTSWGSPETEPVPGDYDGDGRTDYAVFYRKGGSWFIYRSSINSSLQVQWGWSATEPVQADYDGDGKTDVAVYHPPSGTWYIRESASLALRQVTPGWYQAQPVPGYYDGDTRADIAVYDHRSGGWFMLFSSDNKPRLQNWGWSQSEPSHSAYRVDDDSYYYGNLYPHDYDYDPFQLSGSYPRTGTNGPASANPQVPANFAGVEWLHTDVSTWKQTAKLTVSLTSSQIILNYDKANVWPPVDGLVGNPWIFVPKTGGGWYAATFEWMRPGQTAKSLSSVDGSHIKKEPLQNFKPVSGTWYGFMVSGLCRDSKRNVYERSNVYMLKWP